VRNKHNKHMSIDIVHICVKIYIWGENLYERIQEFIKQSHLQNKYIMQSQSFVESRIYGIKDRI